MGLRPVMMVSAGNPLALNPARRSPTNEDTSFSSKHTRYLSHARIAEAI
jgi:hypothetical protein